MATPARPKAKPLGKAPSAPAKSATQKVPQAKQAKPTPPKLKEQRQKQAPEVEKPGTDASGSGSELSSLPSRGKAAAASPSGRLAKGAKDKAGAAKDKKPQDSLKAAKGATNKKDLPQADDTLNQQKVQDAAQTAKDKAPTDDLPQTDDVPKAGEVPEAPDISDNVPLDLSSLDGLEVGEGGKILDSNGNPIGEVVEGDPEGLVGQTVNSNGEIVDEDGDLIGRVDLIQQKAGELKDQGQEAAGLPQAGEVPEAPDISDKVPLDLSNLEGLEVGEGGKILDSNGNPIGEVVEGDPEDLVGQTVNGNGEIVDDDGDLIGRVDLIQQKAGELKDQGQEALGLSSLDGLEVGEGGKILDNNGNPIGEVVEGDPEDLVGQTVNENGEIINEDGDLIGRVDVIQQKAGELNDQAQDLSSLEGLEVGEGGKILDNEGNPIGEVVEGDPGDLAGQKVNDNGEIINEDGDLIGRVDLIQQKAGELKDQGQEAVGKSAEQPEGEEPDEQEDQAEPGEGVSLGAEPELPDISTLEGLTCNKLGSIVRADGTPVGELVEGDPKKLSRGGFQLDSEGQFWDNQGHVIGKAKPIEVEEEKPGLFSELGDIFVAEDSWIQDENGRKVGKLVEGDPKQLVGYAVDDDGDILDKRGNTIGRAEPWEEPEVEPEEVDFSSVEGLKPNKHGNVMGPDQVPIARVVEGELKEVAGRGINKKGEILNDDGEVIGKVQLIPKGERESLGPFSGLGELSVKESGYIEDADGEVVGRIVEGDPKSLRGQTVDISGEILDQYGNVNGRAERYEVPEEEEEEEDLSALEGGTVNKLGNVVDEHGTILGRIVAGNPKKLSGKKVDGNGQVWSDNGKVIGQAELIPEDEREKPEGIFFGLDGLTVGKEGMVMDPSGEVVGRLTEGDPQRLMGRAVDEDGEVIDKTGNVIGRAERYKPEEPEPEPEPELSPEEQEKQKKEKEDAELAKKMCTILQQTIDSVGPICKEITSRTEKASRTPKEELDEEQLVKDVKPLIEKAGNGLQECKGSLRALDPDGHIAATAKARSASHEATPEEYQLADLLKELTQTIVETIEKGREYISDMPHAKKKINPLWALLSEPLFQIIAAVGLLLSGVLGLVGKLLDGLGLGGSSQGTAGRTWNRQAHRWPWTWLGDWGAGV
ncbi:hypothetical protein N7505_007870 [Penicillium chrysogenum]|uniref:DUF6987 domain-containing protein n=1 Tax=Penicillium chrysogenum TaxID=5076 RepID=A0ABQ8WEL2_PENCH|nr:hypothetical protein N7505_007870 [Penicillium chrysogenum]